MWGYMCPKSFGVVRFPNAKFMLSAIKISLVVNLSTLSISYVQEEKSSKILLVSIGRDIKKRVVYP